MKLSCFAIEKHITPNAMWCLNLLSHLHSYWPSWDILHHYLQRHSFFPCGDTEDKLELHVLTLETNNETPQAEINYAQRNE